MSGRPFRLAQRSFHRLFGEGTVVGFSDSQLLERYANENDSVAFEAIVARHGPLVLAVSQEILKDPNDAQDAFQATFLILIRQAGSLWSIKGSLGSWLYRVAQRVAIRIKADADRRRTIEIRAGQHSASLSSQREFSLELHEELGGLPEKFRAPIVLCLLEQMSYAQAAEQLGWTTDTVRGRLARGRALLRSRLIRRGFAIAAIDGLLEVNLAQRTLAAVPSACANSVVNAAASYVVGQAVPTAVVSASASAICEEVLRKMGLQSLLRITAGTLLGITALAWGASAAIIDSPNPRIELAQAPAKPTKAASPAIVSPDSETGTLQVRGRVRDSMDNALEGASIYLFQRHYDALANRESKARPPLVAKSGSGGSFQFVLDKAASDWPRRVEAQGWRQDKILAVHPGYGVAWILAEECVGGKEVTLRLPPDDSPIRGRVLDEQHRPIAGATVNVATLGLPRPGVNLDSVPIFTPAFYQLFDSLSVPSLSILNNASVPKTDRDGQFEIHGIGRDRIVRLIIQGPDRETLWLNYTTHVPKSAPEARPNFSPDEMRRATKLVGKEGSLLFTSPVDVTALPSKPIIGTIRARGNEKPVSGAAINGSEPMSRSRDFTISDKDGRFRLTGLPKGKSYELHAVPPAGESLLSELVTLSDTEGLTPIETTINLAQGVSIRVRLIDKLSGEVVPAREIQCLPLPSNPIRSTPRTKPGPVATSRDQKIHDVIVPSGELMILGAVANQGGRFVRAHLRKEDKGKGIGSQKDKEQILFPIESFQTYKIVDVPVGAKEFTIDLELNRGLSRKGELLDPGGKPISGVLCYGLNPGWETIQPLATAHFEANGLEPGVPRRILFAHSERKLTGTVDLEGDSSPNLPPLRVQLRPAGMLKGRFVDEKGQPLSGLRVSFTTVDLDNLAMRTSSREVKSQWPHDEVIQSDAHGQFQLVGFFPDADSFIQVSSPDRQFQSNASLRKLKLKSGELRDLGDVVLKERQRPTK